MMIQNVLPGLDFLLVPRILTVHGDWLYLENFKLKFEEILKLQLKSLPSITNHNKPVSILLVKLAK